jgi:uncharacterized protein
LVSTRAIAADQIVFLAAVNFVTGLSLREIMHFGEFDLLVLSVLVLGAGPLIYQVTRFAGSMLALLDGFVFVAIGGLVLVYIMPSSVAQAGGWALVGGGAGLFLPSLIEHRLQRLARPAHLIALLLGLTGIGLHAFVDGLALVGEGDHADHMLPVTVVLHRLPVGLTIWLLLRPVYGLTAALSALGLMAVLTAAGFFSSTAVAHIVGSQGWGLFQALVAGSLLHVLLHRSYPVTERVRARGGGRVQGAIGGLAGLALLWTIAADHGVEPNLAAALPVFVNLARESAPALLLAYVAAGLVYGLMPRTSVEWLGRGSRLGQALRGMGFGLPLPICSCGVVPVYRSLARQGVPATAGLAFLVATPELSLDAILISLPLLGAEFTVLRVAAAAVVAVVVGWWVGARVKAAVAVDVVADDETRPAVGVRLLQGLKTGLGEVVDATAPWVLLGLGLAALLEPMLESAWIERLPAGFEVVFFALIGIPTYVCASGATPLVAVLLLKGVSPGAALAFLLTGPATNITTFGVLAGLHGQRAAVFFGATVVGLAVGLGLMTDLFWPVVELPDWNQVGDDDSLLSDWCLAGLTGLFALSWLRRGPRGFVSELFGGEEDHDHDHEDIAGKEHGCAQGESCCAPTSPRSEITDDERNGHGHSH